MKVPQIPALAGMSPLGLKPVYFAIDGDGDEPSYPGIDQGVRWNGWAMPWFDENVAVQIAKDTGAFAYVPALDAYIDARTSKPTNTSGVGVMDETAVYPVREMGGIKHYRLGAGSWCWAPIEEEDAE